MFMNQLNRVRFNYHSKYKDCVIEQAEGMPTPIFRVQHPQTTFEEGVTVIFGSVEGCKSFVDSYTTEGENNYSLLVPTEDSEAWLEGYFAKTEQTTSTTQIQSKKSDEVVLEVEVDDNLLVKWTADVKNKALVYMLLLYDDPNHFESVYPEFLRNPVPFVQWAAMLLQRKGLCSSILYNGVVHLMTKDYFYARVYDPNEDVSEEGPIELSFDEACGIFAVDQEHLDGIYKSMNKKKLEF